MTTETENSTAGGTIRELLIDRQLPRFEARALSTVAVDAGAPRRLTGPSAPWIPSSWGRASRSCA